MEKSFWKELWLLLICVFAGIGVATMTAMLAAAIMPGLDNLTRLHLAQWMQTIVVMLVPSIYWFKIRMGNNPMESFGFKRCDWRALLLTFLLMTCAVPALDVLSVLNVSMPLPEVFENMALSLRQTQMENIGILMQPSGVAGFIELVLLMSIGTALGEETLFRGALLKCFGMTKLNKHWTALMIGFIFSFIHFDPFGFVPRWLLGTLFCYLVFWTGSIWTPILAHALNNLVAVIQYKLMVDTVSQEALMLQDHFSYSWMVNLCSFVVSGLLIWILYRERRLCFEKP